MCWRGNGDDNTSVCSTAAALKWFSVVFFLSCCICRRVNSKCEHCTCTTVCCPIREEECLDDDGGGDEEDLLLLLLL